MTCVCSQIVVSSVEELDLFHEQAVGVPLLMRIWVEFTTNDYIGAPQPDVHFEGSFINSSTVRRRPGGQWRHSLLTRVDKVQGPQGPRNPQVLLVKKLCHEIITDTLLTSDTLAV